MADEAIAVAEETAALPESAPVTESAPEPVEQGAPEPLSLEDAFAQARAQTTEDTSPGEEDGQPAATVEGEPAGEVEQKPEAQKTLTPQGQIDRIYQLWKSGRQADMTAEERGILNRFENDWLRGYESKQSEEAQFRELYVGLLAMESEDPEEFAKTLRSEKGESTLRFMKAYAQAHPDVTLDSPETPVVRREDVRLAAVTEAFDTVDSAIGAVVSKYGLGEEALIAAYEKSGGDFTTYLDVIVEQAASVAERKGYEKGAREERDAAKAELQVAKATRNIVVPRDIGSSAATQREIRVRDAADPFAAAVTLARREISERAS